ncbi:MAG: NUDIX domain-containing protein [Gammaproteobacteria bacterium]
MTSVRKRLSAGVVILRERPEDHVYLLLRAYRYWDFPKGEVESGETPLATAVREVGEETGIRGLDFRWGEDYRETPVYNRGKVARYYLASAVATEVILAANTVTGVREHAEYRWLGYAQARALLVPRVQSILDWAEARAQRPAAAHGI